jgi:glucosamine-6-phosphate deaminase
LARQARFFRNIDEVPKQAVSIGTATLLAAKRISKSASPSQALTKTIKFRNISTVLIVTGSKKASAMKSTIEGGLNHLCPASALQLHADATIVCDKAAVAELEPLTVALFNRG